MLQRSAAMFPTKHWLLPATMPKTTVFQKGWIYDGFLLVHWVAFVAQLAQYLTCRTVELTQLVNTVTLQLSASCVLVRRVSEAAGR